MYVYQHDWPGTGCPARTESLYRGGRVRHNSRAIPGTARRASPGGSARPGKLTPEHADGPVPCQARTVRTHLVIP